MKSLLCGFLYGVISCLHAFSDEPSASPPSIYEDHHEPVRVAVFDFKPLIFLDESNKPAGFFVDLLEHIASQEGWTLQYVAGSWKDGLSRLQSGEVDIVTSAAWTEEREKLFDYTQESAFGVWTQVYVQSDSDIHNLDDLKNKNVGLMKQDINGHRFREEMRQLNVPFNVVWFDSFDEIFHAISEGSVDAGVSANIYGAKVSKTLEIRKAAISLHPFGLHFIVRKGMNPGVLNQLDQSLDTMKHQKDSIYYQLMDEWFSGAGHMESGIPTWLGRSFYISLVVCTGLVVIVLFLQMMVRRAVKRERTIRAELISQLEESKMSKDRLQAVLDGTHAGVWELDFVKDTVDFDDTFASMLDYRKDEMEDSTHFWLGLIHPDDLSLVNDQMKNLIPNDRKVFDAEFRMLSKEGRWVWIHCRGRVTELSEGGIPNKMLGTHMDITSRKLAELELIENEKKYKSLYDNAPLAYQSLDKNGNIIDVNPLWLSILEVEREQAIGHWFGDFLSEDSVELFRQRFPLLQSRGCVSGAEFVVRPKNSDPVMISLEGQAAYDDEGQFKRSYCTFKVLTKEKQLAAENAAMMDRLQLATRIGRISVTDWYPLEKRMVSDNKLSKLLGYSESDALVTLKTPSERLSVLLHPEDQSFIEELTKIAGSPGVDSFDQVLRCLRKDGGEHWVRMAGEVVSRNAQDIPTRIAAVSMDVDREKKQEILQLEHQKQLLKADKLSTLGTLSAGIAHEINNPNQLILSNINFIEFIWPDIRNALDAYVELGNELELSNIEYSEMRERFPKIVDSIKDGSRRIKHIVQELKDYVRENKTEGFKKVDVNKVIYSSQLLTSNLGKKRTDTFTWDSEDNLYIKGDPQRLEQVVVNLLINAFESLGDRSQSVRIRSFDDSKGHIVIEVSDQGCGIAAESIEKVTEPFFTSKQTTGGTGMGLSIANSIIKEHGGELRIESKQMEGTCIKVILPKLQSL